MYPNAKISETTQNSPSAVDHDLLNEARFTLSDVEIETLRRAALQRGMFFEVNRRTYSQSELKSFGLVREAYDWEEIRVFGVDAKVVTCFDASAQEARSKLKVDAPFAEHIEKWQLPIFMPPFRIHQAVFPPNTTVLPHVHPENSTEKPGGSLRVVLAGSIEYGGKIFRSGDWFFIPNGVSYSFKTDTVEKTTILYKYSFFGDEEGNRFSHPHAV